MFLCECFSHDIGASQKEIIYTLAFELGKLIILT